MKKNGSMFYLAICIAFVLFNTLVFVMPINKTATFWVVYAFSVLAFVGQIPLWKFAVGGKNKVGRKFLGIPIVYVAIAYLIVQLIAFTIFVLIPTPPIWVVVVVCVIILVLAIFCIIADNAGINEINRVEEKIKKKRDFIKILQIDIEILVENEADAETKVALKQLAEKVRFSDPMSHEALGEIESRIATKIEEMKKVVDKKSLIQEVDILLTERNKKCKILKG